MSLSCGAPSVRSLLRLARVPRRRHRGTWTGRSNGHSTRNPDRASGGSVTTSTRSTSAPGGPRRQNSTSRSTFSSAPSKTASTDPSGRFRDPACHAVALGQATGRTRGTRRPARARARRPAGGSRAPRPRAPPPRRPRRLDSDPVAGRGGSSAVVAASSSTPSSPRTMSRTAGRGARLRRRRASVTRLRRARPRGGPRPAPAPVDDVAHAEEACHPLVGGTAPQLVRRRDLGDAARRGGRPPVARARTPRRRRE